MLIGIDANEANVPKRVGVGRYASEVIKHLYTLRQSSFSQKNISYVIYTKNEIAADFPKKVDWWQYERVGPRFLWTQIGLPYALWTTRKKPDVFFSPTHYGPRYAPCPRVVSIMDLAYLYYPEYFKKSDLLSVCTHLLLFPIKEAAAGDQILPHLLCLISILDFPSLEEFDSGGRGITVTFGLDADDATGRGGACPGRRK
jgi:hypothetical protein